MGTKNYLQIIGIVAILTGLSGCGKHILCTTTYSKLSLYTDDTGKVSCSDLDNIDKDIKTIFTNVDNVCDPRFRNYDLSGFVIQVHNVDHWIDANQRDVYGLTHCNLGVIEIGSGLLYDTALAHEMAHAIQECQALTPIDEKDEYHSNWNSGGIYESIDKANKLNKGF